MKTKIYGMSLACAVGLLAGTSEARADGSALQSLLTQNTMTGDWGGVRTHLADKGITFNGLFVGDYAYNFSGGKRIGGNFAGQLGIGTNFDLQKLFGLTGGSLYIEFTDRMGRSTSSDYVGNQIQVQEDYGGAETLHFSEFYYKQQLRVLSPVMFKAGLFSLGDDFAVTPMLCDFENVGFCAHPQNLPQSSGWADSPVARWGGEIQVKPAPFVYLATGVFDVNPTYAVPGNTLKVNLSGSTGVIVPVEVGFNVNLADTLPGVYKFGGYYDTSNATSVVDPGDIENGRYGFYALVNQKLINFSGDKSRGLYGFVSVSYSDPRTATLQGTLLGAVIAKGPFPQRPNDFVEFGYVRSVLNHRGFLTRQAALEEENSSLSLSQGEGDFEMGYGFQALPWLLLHPDIQYIMDPGTFSYKNTPNAWVFGFEVKAKL